MRRLFAVAITGSLCLVSCRSKSNLDQQLFEATRKGDLVEVQRLLKNGANPNANNGDKEFNFTVLETSTSHPNVLKALLAAGADPHLRDSSGGSPLYLAAGESAESLRLLLDAGVKPDEPTAEGNTALSFACQTGNVECINLLLAKGANVNHQDSVGFTPLHWTLLSTWTGGATRLQSIRILLQHQADPRIKDGHGRTALDWAMMDTLKRKPDADAIIKILKSAPRVPKADPTRSPVKSSA